MLHCYCYDCDAEKTQEARTVVERVRLELLDVGGGAEPPVLVAATAEPYAAAEAGSGQQQQQEQGQGARHAAPNPPAGLCALVIDRCLL
jgi:hypothetical protein